MKIWITKYALTIGLFEVEAKSELAGMVVYRRSGAAYDEYAHGENRQWARTKDAAVVRAEAMRTAKITSLKKSIAKLERLDLSA